MGGFHWLQENGKCGAELEAAARPGWHWLLRGKFLCQGHGDMKVTLFSGVTG